MGLGFEDLVPGLASRSSSSLCCQDLRPGSEGLELDFVDLGPGLASESISLCCQGMRVWGWASRLCAMVRGFGVWLRGLGPGFGPWAGVLYEGLSWASQIWGQGMRIWSCEDLGPMFGP